MGSRPAMTLTFPHPENLNRSVPRCCSHPNASRPLWRQGRGTPTSLQSCQIETATQMLRRPFWPLRWATTLRALQPCSSVLVGVPACFVDRRWLRRPALSCLHACVLLAHVHASEERHAVALEGVSRGSCTSSEQLPIGTGSAACYSDEGRSTRLSHTGVNPGESSQLRVLASLTQTVSGDAPRQCTRYALDGARVPGIAHCRGAKWKGAMRAHACTAQAHVVITTGTAKP